MIMTGNGSKFSLVKINTVINIKLQGTHLLRHFLNDKRLFYFLHGSFFSFLPCQYKKKIPRCTVLKLKLVKIWENMIKEAKDEKGKFELVIIGMVV